jgi:outer membrane protein TolC
MRFIMMYSARTKRIACVLGILLVFAPGLRAQQADHHPITLADALAIAKKQNVEVMVARLQALESKQATRIARSALLPQANLGLQTLVTRFDLQSISGGDRVTALGPYQVIQGGPGFSQVLFDMGAVRRLQGAQQAETTTQNNEKTTEQTVERAVIAQYLTIDRASAELDRANAREAIAQRLETEAEHLQAAGVGTSIDTLRARYELEAERQRVIDAQAAHKIARQRLVELLELPPDQDIETGSLTNIPNVEPVSPADIETALHDRPEEAAAKSEVKRADLQKKGAFAQHVPTLQFSGFYDQQGRTWGGMIPAYTYQVTANLPIFTSGRIRAENKNAEYEKQRAVETQHGIESAISYQVVAARTNLDASRNALEVAKRATALAHEELIQADHRFSVGVANNIELVTAQQSLAAADASEISSDYLYWEATADLYRALGKIDQFGAQP